MLIACRSCRRQYDVGGLKRGEHVRCRCGEVLEVPRPRRQEVRVLHCSSCGGKLGESARTCEYCASEVTARERHLGPACPECFARMAEGARFCSTCGVAIRPEVMRALRVSASCPRCRGVLVRCELPQVEYIECAACAGIWLEEERFRSLVEEKDLAAREQLVPRTRAGAAEGGSSGPVRYLPCPACGQLMHRKNFAACSGVIIDWCKGHGFWFDAHELEKVVAFVKKGGLDKARRLEIERSKAELERVKQHQKRLGETFPLPAARDQPPEILPTLLNLLGGIFS